MTSEFFVGNYEYGVKLDDRPLLEQLRDIDKKMERLGVEGDRHFKRVGDQARRAGVQIGVASGITQELTRRLIDLGTRGARGLLAVATAGVELNKQAELTRHALTAIFEGNEEAAAAFIARFEGLADVLRTDRAEITALAKSLLPDIGDIDQLESILQSAVILGKDAGKNIGEVRRALEEAAAGQFVSLQRILNVPPEATRRIKALSEEIGIGGALSQVLGERVTKAGLSIENTAGTLDALFSAVNARGQDLTRTFGAPIFEQLKEDAGELLEVLGDEDLDRAVTAFGELAAHVLDIVTADLAGAIDAIDFDQLERTADDLRALADAFDLLAKTIGGGGDSVIGRFFKDVSQGIQDSRRQLEDAARFVAQLRGEIARRQAEAESLIERGRGVRIGPVVVGEADQEARMAGERAYQAMIEETERAFADYEQAAEEAAAATEARAQAGEGDTTAAEEEGEAIVRLNKLYEDLARAQDKAAEATEKIGEKLEKSARDRQRELTGILIDQERERNEAAIKAAQEREDLARHSLERIEDIYREHGQGIEDAATGLSREEADIARKAARQQIEQARDEASARLDVERSYRQELQRIRDRFNQTAEEAERRNDAQAFLAAVRNRDQEQRDARRTRDQGLEEAAVTAAERRQALAIELQAEVEDARLANARKLEDLRLELARELEEQRIENERELAEQAIKEERAAEQRARQNAQELQDFRRKEAERLEDLRRSIESEVALVQKAEAIKRQVRVEEARRAVAEVNAAFARLNPFGGSGLGTRYTPPYYYRGAETRDAGGPVEAGRPYLIGRPEVFIPNTAGRIVPIGAVNPAAVTNTANYDYRRHMANTINVSGDIFSNPVATRRMRNMIVSVVAELL